MSIADRIYELQIVKWKNKLGTLSKEIKGVVNECNKNAAFLQKDYSLKIKISRNETN